MLNEQTKGIGFSTIVITLMVVMIIVILSIIKIYLGNTIYYESKDVNALKTEVSILKAENELLKENIETVNFMNKIENTIFEIK